MKLYTVEREGRSVYGWEFYAVVAESREDAKRRILLKMDPKASDTELEECLHETEIGDVAYEVGYE